MTDKKETSADIIQELRSGPFSWSVPSEIPGVEKSNWDARKYADRLEAALKREVDKLHSAIQATVGRSDAEIDRLWREIAEMRKAGNMAKMRRVCEQILELLKAPPGFNGGGMSVELDEEQVVMWRNRFLDALAAPPPNCDRNLGLPKDYQKAWHLEDGGKTPYHEWLLAVAKQEGGEL